MKHNKTKNTQLQNTLQNTEGNKTETPNQQKKSFQLSEEGLSFIKKQMTRYETKRSAILPSLYRVQQENGGWVPPEAISYLSKIMDIPESYIQEALTFYTLYNRQPIGRLHIQVCCNLSCAINGSREIFRHLCDQFKVQPGQVSKDGLASITCVECLGACDQAPMAQVNDRYIGPLTKDTAVEQIKKVLKNGT